MEIERRKFEYVMICLQKDVKHNKINGFEKVKLVENEKISLEDVDTTTTFLGKEFKFSFFIEAMTGGAAGTEVINKNLVVAVEKLGIGMGVGSQRAAVENEEMTKTFLVRSEAPSILLLGNLGIAQIVKYPIVTIKDAVKSIGADALAIHINPLQELAQPEGDRDTHALMDQLLEKIKVIKKETELKIVAKEVGFGFSGDIAKKLEDAGVDAIDVAGAGGTSWVKIEHYRGSENAKELFDEGIPTAESLYQCADVKVPLIVSGGIRTGEEVAKAIAMGATLVGAALPFLKLVFESAESVMVEAEKIIDELKETMASVGARNLSDLIGNYEYDR